MPIALCACGDPDTFVPFGDVGGPAGVIAGSVTYAGPRPCTRGGEIVGAAVLFAFEEQALPPPEGLATVPAALAVVPGELLFRSVREELPFDPGGALVCPKDDVVVTAPFALAPLPGGVYQVRGFYDRDGDFNPAFSISNLPSQGDIGGGAIDNAAEALEGAPPEFGGIPLGEIGADGRRVIGPGGDLVEGVAATLGLALPLERPLFHLAAVADPYGGDDPSEVVVPADYQLEVFSAADLEATEQSFVRLTLGAGVAPKEGVTAAASPFFLPVEEPVLFHTRQDVNGDGVRDGEDHVPETALLPAIAPLGILVRLADGSGIASQARPTIVWQGVTLYQDLLATVMSPPELAEARAEVLLALRPAVVCVDTSDPSKEAVLLNTHPTDAQGNELIVDEDALLEAVGAQIGRKARLAYGCLPQGSYSVNLVYETGQAWTVPNEAGVCAPSEAPSADGASCGIRPRIASQGVVVRIGEPVDAGYCAEHPPPPECMP